MTDAPAGRPDPDEPSPDEPGPDGPTPEDRPPADRTPDDGTPPDRASNGRTPDAGTPADRIPGGSAPDRPEPGAPEPPTEPAPELSGAEPTVRLPTTSAEPATSAEPGASADLAAASVPAAASGAAAPAARVDLRKDAGAAGAAGSAGSGGAVGETGGPGAHLHPPGPGEPGAVRARRFWSGRRVPAALTAAGGLALSGLFLYDVASVRADRPAMQWRRTLADELATRRLDSGWVILGASVCAALGLWLLVLAVTPGERGVLPMARRGPAAVRAGLDRHAAELMLRDRAMEVPGVRWARAIVARRRIKVRATSHFRELADVERDLGATMDAAVRQLGLARSPRLTVQVRRADKKA